MTFSELVLKLVPVAAVAAVAYFVFRSNPRQRIAVLLAWLFPGLGHWWMGHKDRALFFAGFLIPTFLFGLVLSEFLSVAPTGRHPIWGIAQVPGGLMTGITWLATSGLKMATENPYETVGDLYVGCACLLNLIAMCDVWDLGMQKDPKPTAPPKEAKA